MVTAMALALLPPATHAEEAWAEGAPPAWPAEPVAATDSAVQDPAEHFLDEQLEPPDRPSALADFEDTLDTFGTWTTVGALGRVWQPSAAVVGTEFIPFVTGGRWVSTEQGLGFRSEWSWGRVAFHHGRWTLLPRLGWVWSPAKEWQAAPVAWRTSATHVAWAPLDAAGRAPPFSTSAPGWSFAAREDFGRGFVSRSVVYPVVEQQGQRVVRVGWSPSPAWQRSPEPVARPLATAPPSGRGPRPDTAGPFGWRFDDAERGGDDLPIDAEGWGNLIEASVAIDAAAHPTVPVRPLLGRQSWGWSEEAPSDWTWPGGQGYPGGVLPGGHGYPGGTLPGGNGFPEVLRFSFGPRECESP